MGYSSVIDEGHLRGNAYRICHYSKQLADGLCYMHSQKIIHGDLKPDNVLLTSDDQIKISDFGLTTTTRSVLERYRSGDESLYHIAPELMIKNTRSRNVDMYSFGIVIFEMCFDGPPLRNTERQHLLKMIGQKEVPIIIILDKHMHHPIYPIFVEVTFDQRLYIPTI